MIRAHVQPLNVAVEEASVIVDDSDGVAITLTPRAAAETGERLIAYAKEAQANAASTQHLVAAGKMPGRATGQ
jgi:hypothetical protein